MIQKGTICLLINGHEFAGRTCEVLGPPHRSLCYSLNNGHMGYLYAYDIDIPGAPPIQLPFSGYVAEPHQLVPISNPGLKFPDPVKTDVPEGVLT
jgi:hypothetical protein